MHDFFLNLKIDIDIKTWREKMSRYIDIKIYQDLKM